MMKFQYDGAVDPMPHSTNTRKNKTAAKAVETARFSPGGTLIVAGSGRRRRFPRLFAERCS
ncbi:MAG: hypothetical protein P4L55_17180, partial [Syntrophobacteraceae bacterium]|nr:hypothetical protein [Syntrophobacteraceae bacterium]